MWRAKATSSLKPAKWHPLVLFSPPHITQSSEIHGQTHQPVMLWITADCLLVKGYVTIWRQPEHSWMSDRLRNKPQQKQPGQFSASIPGWIVRQCIQLLFDGEKCAWMLCAWKVASNLVTLCPHTFCKQFLYTYVQAIELQLGKHNRVDNTVGCIVNWS